MLANYGYRDGSGDWFITIDTDKCDGCGRCRESCPKRVLEIVADDCDDLVAAVGEGHRRTIKYDCGPCGSDRPCQTACPQGAIAFSW